MINSMVLFMWGGGVATWSAEALYQEEADVEEQGQGGKAVRHRLNEEAQFEGEVVQLDGVDEVRFAKMEGCGRWQVWWKVVGDGELGGMGLKNVGGRWESVDPTRGREIEVTCKETDVAHFC